MKQSMARTAVAVLLLCAAAASGCASKVVVAPGLPISTPEASTGSASAADPKAQAEQDAAQLLGTFASMPSATETKTAPAGTGWDQVPYGNMPGDPYAAVRIWNVDLPEATAFANAEQHAPHWVGPSPGSGWGSLKGEPMQSELYQSPLTSAVLAEKSVDIDAVALSPTTSAVMVTVIEDYRPAKTAGEVFPDSPVLVASTQAGSDTPSVTTVTDRATIGKVAALLNALPTTPLFGPASCPSISGRHETVLTLAFRDSADGAKLITATLDRDMTVDVCGGGVSVQIGNQTDSYAPSLDPTGTQLFTQITALLGIHPPA